MSRGGARFWSMATCNDALLTGRQAAWQRQRCEHRRGNAACPHGTGQPASNSRKKKEGAKGRKKGGAPDSLSMAA
jgi:hypothetical protein